LVKLGGGDGGEQPDDHHPLHAGVGHEVNGKESVLQLLQRVPVERGLLIDCTVNRFTVPLGLRRGDGEYNGSRDHEGLRRCV
jgi:hypothetical protein